MEGGGMMTKLIERVSSNNEGFGIGSGVENWFLRIRSIEERGRRFLGFFMEIHRDRIR
jgi:hypothetical protein